LNIGAATSHVLPSSGEFIALLPIMTVTISRLYDNHTDAQQAVRRLEAAGVPHSDISLVANNSDSWFNSDK
jgi:hypothetical protein